MADSLEDSSSCEDFLNSDSDDDVDSESDADDKPLTLSQFQSFVSWCSDKRFFWPFIVILFFCW
jgi:hypothetical protein